MPEPEVKSLLERIGRVLDRHGVEYIVIGGQAEMLMGSPRVTEDLDICYRRTESNLERVAAALGELRVTLRNAPPDLPFRIDARSLALGSNFTFDTADGPFDILGWVEPLGDYEELAKRAELHRMNDMTFRTIALDDLIRVKQHIGRPKDQFSLMHLLAIRRVREEGGLPPNQS